MVVVVVASNIDAGARDGSSSLDVFNLDLDLEMHLRGHVEVPSTHAKSLRANASANFPRAHRPGRHLLGDGSFPRRRQRRHDGIIYLGRRGVRAYCRRGSGHGHGHG